MFVKMFCGTDWYKHIANKTQLAVYISLVESLPFNGQMPSGVMILRTIDIERIAKRIGMRPRTVQNTIYKLLKTPLIDKLDNYKGMYVINPDYFKKGV